MTPSLGFTWSPTIGYITATAASQRIVLVSSRSSTGRKVAGPSYESILRECYLETPRVKAIKLGGEPRQEYAVRRAELLKDAKDRAIQHYDVQSSADSSSCISCPTT